MSSLRAILLLAGVVFLIALAVWEKRKPNQAARDAAMRGAKRNEPSLGTYTEPSAEPPAARASSYASWAEGRRAVASPPHIDLPDVAAEVDALQALEAQAQAESAQADISALSDEPVLEPPMGAQHEPSAPSEPAAADVSAAAPSISPVPDIPLAAAPVCAALPEGAAAPPRSLLVDWPPEGERHIVALRIVANSDERLSGRAVRLAITACGFVHGRFGIYHQPDADGRALLSVASLSKPGILDPINMDFQRMSGISLFTVLPGPLAPAAALDHLIDTARELSQRLPARVQDEQGHSLDAVRLEDLRDRVQSLTVRAEPAA